MASEPALRTSLRIGFDIDGVLANFAGAYREIDVRLFGAEGPVRTAGPEEASAKSDEGDALRSKGRRIDAIWTAIRETPDFWTTLKPIGQGAVRRLHSLMLAHRWEVFFITQRPATIGDTVQRQTQRWLIEQGFDMPSVLVIPGARGAASSALSLNYFVDDSATNCVDIKSESKARPILIVGQENAIAKTSARRLGIAT